MTDLIILGTVIAIGVCLSAAMIAILFQAIFGRYFSRWLLRHRVEIIAARRKKLRGYLYTNNQRKDCWL